jgi:hypothetical protein
MAINWRRAMTQDRAYTAPPQYRRADDRSGAANVGPTQPTNWRRAMTQDRAYTAPSPRGTGLGRAIQGAAGNVRDAFLPGIMGLGQRALGGINQNIEDHRYLDSILDRDEKNRAFWNQAGGNYMGRAQAAGTIDPETGRPMQNVYGASLADISGGETLGGTSLGQAGKYFKKAGLTQNDLDKFLGHTPSKWTDNEAWLSSQAADQDAFKTGMSFIKNAKATANLRRNLEDERAVDDDYYTKGELYDVDPGGVGFDDDYYTKGELYDVDPGEPEDIFGNIPEPGIYGRPDWDNLDSIYDFERQRQKAAFSPKLLAEDRAHPTIPLGRRTFTASPIEVDYPFGLDDDISPLPLGSNAALAARGYWEPNITPIFEDDEELTPAQLYNPRIE